jgi:hypothetical protein
MQKRVLDTETQRGLFCRAVATLRDMPPDVADAFVIASRPPELREAIFAVILNELFPRLSQAKREVFCRIVHVLEE